VHGKHEVIGSIPIDSWELRSVRRKSIYHGQRKI
jgi:hypothetical protein